MRCGAPWSTEDGLRVLYEDASVQGNDRLLRYIYDGFAPLHDPAVRVLIPLVGSGRESTFRRRYLDRLELDSLSGSVRILEVGVGSGANLGRIAERLPAGVQLEYWGLDLSRGMLRVLVRRLRRGSPFPVRLVLGDAHALPFPDASFDRVFHVGATNSFHDPRRALAELARVAKPGTPIVVVDERLDPNRSHTLYHRAMFRLVCFYDPHPVEPTTLLPPGVVDVLDEQIARMLYSIRFRVPGPRG
jgi:ubiquinone/menaquinone biosynthesis C-methylase UbiE